MKQEQDQLYNLSDLLAHAQTILAALSGAAKAGLAQARDKREDIAEALDLVTRKDFDLALAMIKKARQKQTALEKRIKAIEDKMTLSSLQMPPKKKQNRRS